MKPFSFALLLLAQRVDGVLGMERRKLRPDPLTLTVLREKKRRIGLRLRRSLGAFAHSGS